MKLIHPDESSNFLEETTAAMDVCITPITNAENNRALFLFIFVIDFHNKISTFYYLISISS